MDNKVHPSTGLMLPSAVCSPVMGTISIRQQHNLGQEGAQGRLRGFEEQMSKYGATLEWKGNRAEVKGMGVSGSALVTEEAVEITIKLGMIAKAVGVDEDRLQASLQRRLGLALADDPGDSESA